jgi:enoyl-[acyl-carrier-protein] reductase (NADH)
MPMAFARAAVCIPHVRVADPNFNAAHTLGLAVRASDLGCALALFLASDVSSHITGTEIFIDGAQSLLQG